jgi:hypothetical protein
MLHRVLTYLATAMALWHSPGWAGEKIVDPDLAIPVYLKIITYDNSFDAKKLKTIQVFLLYDQSNAKSYSQMLDVDEYFRTNRDLQVSGVDVEFHPLQYDKLDSACRKVLPTDYAILIVSDFDGEKIKRAIPRARDCGLRTFTLDPDLVALGFAVSVKPDKKKNAIVINLEQARREGSQFGAHLLKMCEIYEGTP